MKTYRTSLSLRLQIAAAMLAFATPSAFAGLLVAVGNTILDYNTNGTPNGTYVTLPAGYSATGMTTSGGNLYLAANSGTTGKIYKYEPGTSTLSVFATPGVGTPIQQIDFASDGRLYFAVQGVGIYATTGASTALVYATGNNSVGLQAGASSYVVWGTAGNNGNGGIQGYGDLNNNPGVFPLVGPGSPVDSLVPSGFYYVATSITGGSAGYIVGTYHNTGKTQIRAGVGYNNRGSILAEFGTDGDSDDQVTGLTVDPSGNLYASVTTNAGSAIYSFIGQTGSPTLIASVAGAGNILYFATPTLSGYSNWAVSKGLDPLTDGAPGFDKDNDGATNLQEYAFFTDPNSGSSTPSLVMATDGSNVTLTYQRAVNATDVSYRAESSTDLVIWTTLDVTDAPTGNTTADTTEYRATVAKGSDPAKFLRVQVTLAP